MKKAILFIGLLFFVFCIVSADFETGNTLLMKLEKKLENKDYYFDYAFAFGYIIGVFDACVDIYFSTPGGIIKGQVHDIAIKFLKENPERRHEMASILLLEAFEKAFPKKEGEEKPLIKEDR